jgi:recombination protein RecA
VRIARARCRFIPNALVAGFLLYTTYSVESATAPASRTADVVDKSRQIIYRIRAYTGEEKANMNTAAELRKQIESALAERIPAALSMRPAAVPELVSCGIAEVDAALGGGLPLGGISELTGAASSGRTTLAWATLAGITLQGCSGAYVDVSDSFDPLSAAALGVDLHRLLWVRPGAPTNPLLAWWGGRRAVTRGGVEAGEAEATVVRPYPSPAPVSASSAIQEKTSFGRGGCHPRAEAIGVDRAVSRLFDGNGTSGNPSAEPRDFTPRCSEPIRRKRIEPVVFTPPAGLSRSTAIHAQRGGVERKLFTPTHVGDPGFHPTTRNSSRSGDPGFHPTTRNSSRSGDPGWGRLDRALRATDLLLNAGGFRVIVLDLGDVSPEYARRVPLATWYRFRLQVEKSQTLFLLLTQMACANSCAAVSLHCEAPQAEWRQAAESSLPLLTGVRYGVSIARNRVVDPYRKKPAAPSSHYAKDARSGDPAPSPHYAKDARSGDPAPSPHYAKDARSGDPASVEVSWSSTTLWSR